MIYRRDFLEQSGLSDHGLQAEINKSIKLAQTFRIFLRIKALKVAKIYLKFWEKKFRSMKQETLCSVRNSRIRNLGHVSERRIYYPILVIKLVACTTNIINSNNCHITCILHYISYQKFWKFQIVIGRRKNKELFIMHYLEKACVGYAWYRIFY